MTKQKKKSKFQIKVLQFKIILTIIFCLAFFAIFFSFGGINVILNRIGDVACFADLGFEVHYIDVGQGDSIFLRFPDNSTMLIDAGPATSAQNLTAYLKDVFKQEGLSCIDYVVFTHQDADHVGGGSAIFDEFVVRYLYRPTVLSVFEDENNLISFSYPVSQNKTYNNAIVAAYYEQNCTIRFSSAGIEWGDDEFYVRFLSPSQTSYSNSNNYSPIIKVEYQNRSFLFTGDAEDVAETEVIASCPQLLKADVLKISHHGSNTSTSSKFLSYVQPQIAIISVGKNNSYGHPSSAVLSRLKDIGCKVYQTSILGSIALSVDKNGNVIMGGSNNHPPIDLTLIIAIFVLALLIIWGIKPTKKIKNRQK